MDLTLDNVGKCYDGTWVLEGIDLTIGTGEFFSLLGASGSGKTTLLKAIAGSRFQIKGVSCTAKPTSQAIQWRTGPSTPCFRAMHFSRT